MLLLLGSIGLTSGTAGAADATAEQAFVDALNEIRAAEGLAPLRLDTELTIAARNWTDTMVGNADDGAGRGALAHAADLSVGISVYWTKLGENVGYGPDVDVLVNAFVASPSHYRNIVDPDFESIGVGVSYDAEGTMWTTHRFVVSEAAPENLDEAPEILAFEDAPAEPAAAPAEPADAPEEEPAAADDRPIVVVAELLDSVGADLAGLGL